MKTPLRAPAIRSGPGKQARAARGRPAVPKNDNQADFSERWQRERPDLNFEWMRVAVSVHEIEQAFRGDLARAVIPEVGGGLADFDVLSHLRSVGPPYALRPTDLFRALSITSGAVTGRIDRLVKLGWVIRDSSPADGRASLVRLTTQGMAVSDWLATYGAGQSVIARALETMTTLQRRQLIELLEKLHGAIVSVADA